MADPEALEDLLARTALKDRRAFETLYQKSSAQLFGVVLRIVRDRELAGEILQESYLKIWHHAGDFRPERARPMTWLGSIARNQAIDQLRRQAARPQGVAMDELYWLTDETGGPQDQADQEHRSQQLHHCLAQLEGEQRRAMQLAWFQGLTHEELAERLERPLGTVKSWLRRGLQRLKQCLEQP